jgi:hypothetical protein
MLLVAVRLVVNHGFYLMTPLILVPCLVHVQWKNIMWIALHRETLEPACVFNLKNIY